jgi:hypothetical protein
MSIIHYDIARPLNRSENRSDKHARDVAHTVVQRMLINTRSASLFLGESRRPGTQEGLIRGRDSMSPRGGDAGRFQNLRESSNVSARRTKTLRYVISSWPVCKALTLKRLPVKGRSSTGGNVLIVIRTQVLAG